MKFPNSYKSVSFNPHREVTFPTSAPLSTSQAPFGLDKRSLQRSSDKIISALDAIAPAPIRSPIIVNSVSDVLNSADAVITLREAIQTANTTIGADTIAFNLASGSQTIALTGGQLTITDHLTILGTGATSLTINGVKYFRAFQINKGVEAQISGLTIADGRGTQGGDGGGIWNQGKLTLSNTILRNNSAYYGGGAIFNTGDLTLIDSTLENNTANYSGGGILNVSEASLTLQNSVVRGNQAHNINGGGIYNNGTLSLIDSIVDANQATGGDGGGIFNDGNVEIVRSAVHLNRTEYGHGGGILNRGILTLNDSILSDNQTNYGRGGGIDNQGQVTIHSSWLENNRANHHGGAIANLQNGVVSIHNSTLQGNRSGTRGGAVANANNGMVSIFESIVQGNNSSLAGGGIANFNGGILAVEHSTFDRNSASYGGAIDVIDAVARIVNSTLSGNGANYGGAIAVGADSSVEINHSTISTNVAEIGGGIYGKGTIKNSIVAGNYGRTQHRDVSGSFNSQGYNLIGDNTGSDGFNAIGDIVGTAANPIDPKLGILQDNGGSTFTHAPLHGSAAIDAAEPNNTLTIDQRGSDRSIGGRSDIGAVERFYNGAPIAQADSFSMTESTTLTLPVLTNDFDPEGDRLSFVSLTQPSQGRLDLQDDGTLIYTANPDFSGIDSFSYVIQDIYGTPSAPATVTITVNPLNFEGTSGADTLTGTGTGNTLRGKAGNDLLYGMGGDDILHGDSQNDTLFGGDGNDTLNGGSQDDVLSGGVGSDRLIGGTGNDRYVYTSLTDAGDTINDFINGNDVLDLRELLAGLNYQASNAIANGYLRFVRKGGNTEVQIKPNGTNSTDFTLLVTLNGVTPDALQPGQNLWL